MYGVYAPKLPAVLSVVALSAVPACAPRHRYDVCPLAQTPKSEPPKPRALEDLQLLRAVLRLRGRTIAVSDEPVEPQAVPADRVASAFPWYFAESKEALELVRHQTDQHLQASLRTLFRNCSEQLRRPVNIRRLLSAEPGLVFVDASDVDRALREAYRPTRDRISPRERFRQRFPYGLMRLAAPCYSQDSRVAIVYQEIHDAPMNAFARLLVLVRRTSDWSIIDTLSTWRH
jgi:hypothetical protein